MSHNERVIGLVEDDQIMGESIVQRLALEGVTVKWWQCGRDAIREIPVSKLEAIVCDIRLPDLNGEDVRTLEQFEQRILDTLARSRGGKRHG